MKSAAEQWVEENYRLQKESAIRVAEYDRHAPLEIRVTPRVDSQQAASMPPMRPPLLARIVRGHDGQDIAPLVQLGEYGNTIYRVDALRLADWIYEVLGGHRSPPAGAHWLDCPCWVGGKCRCRETHGPVK